LSIEDVLVAMAQDWALLSTLAYCEPAREAPPIAEAASPPVAA
jgi:hypothetical protein